MHYLTSKGSGRFPLPQGNLVSWFDRAFFCSKNLYAEETPQSPSRHHTEGQRIPPLASVSPDAELRT